MNIAIVGATGLVGKKIIKILAEENLLNNTKLSLFVSKKNYGKSFIFEGQVYRLLKLTDGAVKNHYDVVFFSAGDDIGLDWAKKFAEAGSFVIDNSNAFRREKTVPLVVPEINLYEVKESKKLIANPNCSTIQLAVVISRLLKIQKINKIIVSTYQSVSGAGGDALKDLFEGTNVEIKEGIKNNFIPKIGKILESGYCTEEDKIMFELNKILNSEIEIYATSVRVPVPYCHGESVYVEFDSEVCLAEIKASLNCEYIVFDEDLSLPENVYESNKTYVCRLRKAGKNGIEFFVVADNLRRGAAYNAVMIYKFLLDNFIKTSQNSDK